MTKMIIIESNNAMTKMIGQVPILLILLLNKNVPAENYNKVIKIIR